MSTNIHTLTLDAMKLDAADRLRLAAELIDSVEGPADPDWDEAWLAELERRRARGLGDVVPWDEARRRVLARLAR